MHLHHRFAVRIGIQKKKKVGSIRLYPKKILFSVVKVEKGLAGRFKKNLGTVISWPWLTIQYPPDVEQQCSTSISDYTFTVYSLVQWNWFSGVTGCMKFRCIQWRQARETISLQQAVQVSLVASERVMDIHVWESGLWAHDWNKGGAAGGGEEEEERVEEFNFEKERKAEWLHVHGHRSYVGEKNLFSEENGSVGRPKQNFFGATFTLFSFFLFSFFFFFVTLKYEWYEI